MLVVGDKRIKRLMTAGPGERVPLSTMKDNARGTIPSLRHARNYKRALKLPYDGWFEEAGT